MPMIDRSHGLYAIPYVVLLLRFTDVGLMEPKLIKKLELNDYIEYCSTFQLPGRGKKFERFAPNAMLIKCTTKFKRITKSFIMQKVGLVVVKYLFFCVCVVYMQRYRYRWQPTKLTVDLTSYRDWFDYYILGHALCLLLDTTSLGILAFSLIMNIQYVDMMNAPFLATSIKDFWIRWNVAVQNGLRRIVFEPIMHYVFKYDWPLPRVKVNPYHTMFAGFMTFVGSGLMHEWMIYILLKEPTRWEQMLYFCIQGCLITGEVAVQKLVKRSTGVDLAEKIPYAVSVVYTTTILTFLSPMFLNPYIRDGVLERFSIFNF